MQGQLHSLTYISLVKVGWFDNQGISPGLRRISFNLILLVRWIFIFYFFLLLENSILNLRSVIATDFITANTFQEDVFIETKKTPSPCTHPEVHHDDKGEHFLRMGNLGYLELFSS